MGRNSVVVAVLLEHSVNVATSRLSKMAMANGGIFFSGESWSPSHLDKFETCKYKYTAKNEAGARNVKYLFGLLFTGR